MKISSIFFLALLTACGNSPTVNVRIQIASNATPANLMQSIHEKIQSGQSKGVYFRFDALKFCGAQSINDFDPAGGKLEPDTTQLGADPTKSSFTIDTSKLDPNKIYSVRMLAFDINGATTNIGYLNCPLSIKYPEANQLVICFGNVTPDPFCAGSTPFLSCNLTPDQAQSC